MQAVGRWSAGLAAVAALVLSSQTPALAQPKPRKELYWFDWWELENKVWPLTTGKGVTVAVVDEEVNRGLPDLSGSVLPNVNLDEIRVRPDPKNGGHGTAMAALIVGQGRGTGMVGVAPGAKVLPLIAHGDITWGLAIRYAADHGAKVVNMSLGSQTFLPCPPDLQQAIAYAVRRDVIIVASAGNEGRHADWRSTPANCPGVFAIGGLDGFVKPWAGTTPGEYVMAAAPAVGAGTINGGGQFQWRGAGTSPSAALVSGVVALVRSKYPQMPAREVVQRILATSKDVGKPGWDDVTGYGLVRPYRALTDKVPPTAPNPVYASFDRSQENNGKVRSESRASKGRTPSPQVTPKPQASSGPLYREPVILLGLVGGMLALCLGAVFWRVNVKQR
ncbi:S8 family serine peptidase [Spirillospora sp. NPDC047279]|uniref:S8 family serine peptidase n=1 Tax=Spirillospora sp. NPDC047279 TaxID=3155478 RepID=UPI0033C572D9